MDNKTPTLLEESIHILNVINKNILRYNRALSSLPDYNVNIDAVQALNTMTFEHSWHLISSYFDEYHDHFFKNLSEEEKNKILPYYKRIKMELRLYPDIKKFRNQVIAHNLRVDHKSVPVNIKLNSYKIPQNIMELTIVTTCIEYLTIIINRNFPSAFGKVSKYIAKHHADNIAMKETPLTFKQASEILLLLKSDIEKLDKELGV
ncbi:hypothetical protein ACQKCH_04890 [Nubsella zeaxanthinifaciens]|uniref:hypothetical protein n=1 Tax=Nubsella zeaxanthinifaciens TaxID=392412 RepID=UPI003D00B129